MATKSIKIPPRKRFALPLLFITCFLVLTSFHFPAKNYTLTTVVIDPGHGGHDSGCLGHKVKEKNVALAISLKLGKYIEDNFPEVKVIYTRKTDVFLELHERAEIANNAKADLFICVHSNAACYRDTRKKKDVCNGDIHGAETWVMGLHKADANLEVAKRENEVVLLEKDYTQKYDGFDPNSPEANIIFSLYQNAYLDNSLKFASLVQDEMGKRGREDRGVKQAGFLVLFKTSMPGVLIEAGFLSNATEAKYLASAKGQSEIAESIFKAFKNYKTYIESGEVGPAGVKKKEIPGTGSDTGSQTQNKDAGTMLPTDTHGTMNPASDTVLTGGEPRYTGKKKSDASNILPKNPFEFAVQILVSPDKLDPSNEKFKGLKEVHRELDGRLFKYTTQRFKKFEDASVMQKKMEGLGFKGAFVVAYKNRKRIPLVQAKEELKNLD